MQTHCSGSSKRNTSYTSLAQHILVLSAALLAATVLFTGCYWSPDSQGGDVAVSITLPSSVSGSGELGALNTPTTFLYVFVLDEGVMTVSPVQAALIHARIAYGDVTYAMEQAITSNENNLSQAADGFSMPVGLSSSKFQQLAVAASGTGTRAFSDLPAGREFLVGAYGVNVIEPGSYDLYVGYGTATVRAGSSTAVNIELGQDPIPFFDYVVNNYGLARLELDSFGLGSTNSFDTNSPLYYDLLTTVHTDFTSEVGSSLSSFDPWYQDVSVATVDVSRNSQSKSGSRRPLGPEYNGQFHIVGVLPSDSWNILITDWASRDNAESGGRASLLNDFFSAQAGATVSLDSYDGGAFYGNVWLTS